MGRLKITPDAQEKLLNYHYPGNVRELRAVMELAAVMANDNKIRKEDIQFHSTGSAEDNFLGQERTLKAYTLQILKHFLKKYNRNVLLVAKKLDIGKSTIYRMLQEHKEELKDLS